MDHRSLTRLALALTLTVSSQLSFAPSGHAQDGATAPPSPVYETPAEQQAPPPSPAAAQGATPAQGQWVHTTQGWVWVPAGSTTYAVNDVPYAYLYLPAYGWGWYASPWGYGPYAYGPWVGRPWPFGFRSYRASAWRGGGGWGRRGFGGYAHGGGFGGGGFGHGGGNFGGHGGHR